MLKETMAKAEKIKVKKKTPQDVVDALVASFFDTLYDRLSKASASNYAERIELLTADTIDFGERKKQLEFEREAKEADRILSEFNEIFVAHVLAFWQYVGKVQEANWPSHKDAVRYAWTRWATKAERTVKLIQVKTEICISNLKLYRKPYPQMVQLKKLSKITSEQLHKSWLNKKNPITGAEIEGE